MFDSLLPTVHAKLVAVMGVSVAIFILCSIARFKLSKRRVMRTNEFGVQQFQSYRQMFWTTQVEQLVYTAAATAQPISGLAALACVLLLTLM